jgi:hypothetical protein
VRERERERERQAPVSEVCRQDKAREGVGAGARAGGIWSWNDARDTGGLCQTRGKAGSTLLKL